MTTGKPYLIVVFLLVASIGFSQQSAIYTNDLVKFNKALELYNNEQNIECREARLFISGSGETCAIKNETKIIDLRALTSAEVRDAEVLLHVGGWRTKMTYVYVPHKN